MGITMVLINFLLLTQACSVHAHIEEVLDTSFDKMATVKATHTHLQTHRLVRRTIF